MKKKILSLAMLLAFNLWGFSAIAQETAREDTNHVPSLLAEYNSVTKRVQADTNGNLQVNINANTGIGSEYVDDADWTNDTSEHVLMGGVFTPGHSITSGDTGPIRVDANGDILTTADSGYVTMIDNITLDDSPTTTTSSVVLIGARRKISFLISYDETEVGNSVSGDFTIEVSPDNSTWIDYDIILDQNGEDSPQGSLNFTIDDEDVCYLPYGFPIQYICATFAGTNTDADDTIAVSIWMCWQN